MLTRRKMLHAMGLTAAASTLPGLALASADTDKRLVFVVLRGAVDGLALAAPYGDGKYRRARGELALAAPGDNDGVLGLDGLFGLHPSLTALHERYAAGEAVIVHAVASPYRERSHFDGQDLLESGATSVGATRDGWLNRALAAMSGTTAIALAQNTPLVLRGDIATVSWAPSRLPDADDSTIGRLQSLYAGDEFFALRLEQALRAQDIAMDMGDGGQRGNEARQFGELASAAARFLTADDGPRIAVLEFGGWDTHANQGTANGQLANRFAALDTGLDKLRQGLRKAWNDTVIVVATEFGRTVQVNGTRGTDHGTATASVVLGGAVNGGRVIADWPGLGNGNLYEGRDLQPTTDLRSVFKGILEEHLDLPPGFVDREVFPDSTSAKALRDLLRA